MRDWRADFGASFVRVLLGSVMFAPRIWLERHASHLAFIFAPLACHTRTGLGLPYSAKLVQLRQHAVRLDANSEVHMIKKTVLTSTALAVAIAFSPVQAAGLSGPNAQPAAASLVHPVKAKREGKIKKMMHKLANKMKGHRRHARYRGKHVAMSHGGCKGAYMYRKGGKCLDARNK
jgi:hypothetical protein